MLLDQLTDHFITGDLTLDPLPGKLLCVLGNRYAFDSITVIRYSFCYNSLLCLCIYSYRPLREMIIL